MDYFYDGQVRRYLTQFIQIMSNFAYKDAKGQLVRVPVRYGDMTRQVGQILKKNSENTIPSAPFIACYIKDMQYDLTRLQDPTFISKVRVRERAFDEDNNEYLNVQGNNYTIERIMPSPYKITFSADIWSTNTEQKLQIWEQLVVFFNPSFEIQTTDNYIDWTSLSTITLENQVWSSRTVPQGINEDIDILTMSFSAPIWITPPAKVKKLGIITKIISNLFAESVQGTISTDYSDVGAAEMFQNASPDATVTVTPGNFDLLVLNNTARLIHTNGRGDGIDVANPSNTAAWTKLLDIHPGKFRAGLSQLRFTQPAGNDVIAYISLDPSDEFSMVLNIDSDTIPGNTIILGRGTVDAVIDPEKFNPDNIVLGTRYLILEDINISDQFGLGGYDGPDAWKNTDLTDFQAHANDIIEWDGSSWSIVFDSAAVTAVTYITNSYTGTQYKWSENSWSKSYEGIYEAKLWRLIL
jgi:hypothetical protein